MGQGVVVWWGLRVVRTSRPKWAAAAIQGLGLLASVVRDCLLPDGKDDVTHLLRSGLMRRAIARRHGCGG